MRNHSMKMVLKGALYILGLGLAVSLQKMAIKFQSLEWSDPDWIGDDKIPASWAIISSFVDINKHRRGIGKALFQQTTKYAQEAQVEYIEATIRADNENGLRYYSSLGFYEYDVLKGVALSNGVLVDRIRKKFKVQLYE